MHGPLGGLLEGEPTDRERLPPGFAYAPAGPVRAVPPVAGDVEIVVLERTRDGVVRYDRTFGTWTPLLDGPEPREALPRIAAALAALHAEGVVHGDLGPRMVGWRTPVDAGDPSPRLSLVIAAQASPASGSLARALILAQLDALASASYVAPEVALSPGAMASAASDVFALAALVHRVVTGSPPLGQLEALPPLVRAALAPHPAHRPSAADLALHLCARTQAGETTPASLPDRADVARGLVPSPVQREALRADGAQMSTMLLVLLVLGGAFVFFGAIWLVTTNWGALGEAGHFVLLLVLTLGAGGAGATLERRGYGGTGMTLTLLASCLLWADAAYVLDIEDALSSSGAWAAAAACVTLGSAALLLGKRGPPYAWVTAIDLAVLAGCLGDYLASGNPLGPALYAALVAAVFSASAFAASWLPAREPASLGLPFALVAVLCTWLSAGAALFLFADGGHPLFATLWPYLLLAPAGLVALVTRAGSAASAVYRWCALATLVPLLLLTPTVEVLVNHDSAAYLAVPLALGFGALGALAFSPANDLRDLARAILGIVNVGAAASLLALIECSDVGAEELLAQPRLQYFLAWVLGSIGLALFGYVASGRAVSKPVYRLVEVTGLLELFAVATVLSLFRPEDTFFPALIFGSGAALLFVGLWTRRASLLVAAAIALLVNLSLQYFVRLHHLLPTAVLIIGFGVLLLGLGLAYERRLKRLLPMLRAWS